MRQLWCTSASCLHLSDFVTLRWQTPALDDSRLGCPPICRSWTLRPFRPPRRREKLKRLQTRHWAPTKCQLTTFFVTRRFVATAICCYFIFPQWGTVPTKALVLPTSDLMVSLHLVGAGFQQHTAEVVAVAGRVESWHKICRWNSWTGTSTGQTSPFEGNSWNR